MPKERRPWADDPTSAQSRGTSTRDKSITWMAVGLVLLSVLWALREPAPPKQKPIPSAVPVPTAETIPLVTGDEPIIEIFTRAGCPVCHIIPGITGANGRVGPPLTLGTTGKARLNDPVYRGNATTVRDYILESVLEPQRFIVPGYPEHTMPEWYGSKLSALALEKIASYLERQAEEGLTP